MSDARIYCEIKCFGTLDLFPLALDLRRPDCRIFCQNIMVNGLIEKQTGRVVDCENYCVCV